MPPIPRAARFSFRSPELPGCTFVSQAEADLAEARDLAQDELRVILFFVAEGANADD
jgi:hypothetical protein